MSKTNTQPQPAPDAIEQTIDCCQCPYTCDTCPHGYKTGADPKTARAQLAEMHKALEAADYLGEELDHTDDSGRHFDALRAYRAARRA